MVGAFILISLTILIANNNGAMRGGGGGGGAENEVKIPLPDFVKLIKSYSNLQFLQQGYVYNI